MRMRGRRVALLLAGALPLLAEETSNDNIHTTVHHYHHHHPPQREQQQHREQTEQQKSSEEPLNTEQQAQERIDSATYDEESEVDTNEDDSIDLDDETLSSSWSLPTIPLHLKEGLPAMFDSPQSVDEDSSLALVFSGSLSASRSLQESEEDDNKMCRRRLPSLPFQKKSPMLSSAAKEPAPSCPVRPDPSCDDNNKRILDTTAEASALERLEASLLSYVGRVLPNMAFHETAVDNAASENEDTADDVIESDDSGESIDPTNEKDDNDEEDSKEEDLEGKVQDYEVFVYEDYPIDDTGTDLLLEELSTKKQQKEDENEERAAETEASADNPDDTATEDVESSDNGEVHSRNETTSESSETQDDTASPDNETDSDDEPADEEEQQSDEDNDKALGVRTDPEEKQLEDAEGHDGAVDDEEEDEALYERVSVDYASKSAGALIIKKSENFKGTSNLLNGDRDKYAIAPCSEKKKSVVLSLSEDILVKVIKLANYERFSSTVKDFQVLGSQTLGKWMDLGTYHAEPGHGEQTFTLTNPTWARYLKFKLLTHHGAEHYCTLSQIMVHGSTMVQGFHEQWEMIEEKNEDDENAGELEIEALEVDHVSESSDKNNTSNETSTKEAHDDNASQEHETAPRLDTFQSSALPFQMLGGEIQDDAAVSEFYDHIPSALGALPTHSKHSMERSKPGGESLPSHQITHLAMQSFSAPRDRRSSDDAPLGFCNHTGCIAVPKMNDLTTESLQQKFGSSIPSGLDLNLSKPLDPTTEESSENDSISLDDIAAEVPGDPTVNPEDEEETVAEEGADKLPASTVSEKKSEPSDVTVENVDIVIQQNEAVDGLLARLLEDLPSADCLAKLDFSDFKAKISDARKSAAGGPSQGGGMMEPIFKKLMDEIFSLQTSLSVHDQFTKASVECYQRILLDMAMEMEKVKGDHEERLQHLEKRMQEPAILRFITAVFQYTFTGLLWIGRRLPGWYVVAKDDFAVPFLGWLKLQTLSILRGLLPYWRKFKASFASLDNSTLFHRVLTFVIEFVDGVVDKLSTTSDHWVRDDFDIAISTPTSYDFFSAWPHYSEEGFWAYPVLPFLLLLLVCRIFMCFTSSYNNIGKTRVVRSPVRKQGKEGAGAAASSAPMTASKSKRKRSKSKKNTQNKPENGINGAVQRPNGDESAWAKIEEEEESPKPKHVEESAPALIEEEETAESGSGREENQNGNNVSERARVASPTVVSDVEE